MSTAWNSARRWIAFICCAGLSLAALLAADVSAADRPDAPRVSGKAPRTPRAILSAEEWRRLDHAVDRGLEFISKSQETDGSFQTVAVAQPGVTSLCVMALLSRGHQPGKGRYGEQIERAVDFVLDMQDPESGAITPNRNAAGRNLGSSYSHAISGLMLAEVYGMTSAKRHERINAAVVNALRYTRKLQTRRKRPYERGGWRYVFVSPFNDSDLSVTVWQLTFLRSARNAEFAVPEEWAKDAMDYVHRSFDANERSFVYALTGNNRYCTRGMAGAGIVSLEMGGEHRSEAAKLAGDYILRNSFEPYNNSRHKEDRYHYGAFYCSQAMFQLGGQYWDRFFPGLLKVLSENQQADGSWSPEAIVGDEQFGSVYTTSLAVLALATPYQLLPIYQR